MNSHNQFLFASIRDAIFPLLPIFVHLVFFYETKIPTSTLYITLVMYSLSIGLKSNSIVVFILSILVAVIFSAGYGFVLNEMSDFNEHRSMTGWMIVTVGLISIAENYLNVYKRGKEVVNFLK